MHIYSWERREVKRSWKFCWNSCYVFKRLQLDFRMKGFFLFSCTLKFPCLSVLTQNEAIPVSRVICRCPRQRGCLRTEMCEHSEWILLYLLLPMRNPEIIILSRMSRKAYTVETKMLLSPVISSVSSPCL